MSKPDCPRCGSSLQHVRRTQEITPNGHHNNVYRCPDSTCPREEIVAG